MTNPIADRMPPAIIVGLRPQRSDALPPGTRSTPPIKPTASIAVPALAADSWRWVVTRSGSRASSPPAPTSPARFLHPRLVIRSPFAAMLGVRITPEHPHRKARRNNRKKSSGQHHFADREVIDQLSTRARADLIGAHHLRRDQRKPCRAQPSM